MQKHWQRVEALIREGIRQALKSKSPTVEVASRQAVEYLKQNELGLALDDCEGLADELAGC